MKKKRNKNNLLRNIIITCFIIIIIIIVFFYYLETGKTEEEKVLKEEGYTTTIDDAFFKKIVTNNTLDDFYNDISNNKDSKYEEYYFAKDSYNYIELKMEYKDQATKTINIQSDLRKLTIDYTYEITKGKTHLLIEGNSSNNNKCSYIIKKGVDDNTSSRACNEVQEEINSFIEKRTELLNNEKVQELINQPIKQYVEEDK